MLTFLDVDLTSEESLGLSSSDLGIGNKLTERGVVLVRNKVKVAVIQ